MEYKDGEMEAWSEHLQNPAQHPTAIVECSRGHRLETPIALTQQETDERCIKCAEGWANGVRIV
jgi:hypothetical protein